VSVVVFHCVPVIISSAGSPVPLKKDFIEKIYHYFGMNRWATMSPTLFSLSNMIKLHILSIAHMGSLITALIWKNYCCPQSHLCQKVWSLHVILAGNCPLRQ